MLKWKLALRQGLAYKRPLLAVGAAVLVSITVLAAAPIYFAVLTELGLRSGLTTSDRVSLNVQVSVPLTSLEPTENAQTREAINSVIDETVGWLLTDRRVHTETSSFVMSREGQPVPTGPAAPRAFLESMPQIEEHVLLVEGVFPESGVTLEEDEGRLVTQVRGMVGSEGARLHNIGVGDVILMNRGRGPDRRRLRVHVDGVVVVADRRDIFWMGNATAFLGQTSLDTLDAEEPVDEEVPPMGIFVHPDMLLESMTTEFPGQPGTATAFLYTDLDRIDVGNVDRVRDSVATMAIDLTNALPRAISLTGLTSEINRFEKRTFFSRVPLVLLIVLVELVALYVLTMVSTLLIDAQRSSMALAASRGAGQVQILSVYGMQGVFLAALGLLLGPPLAALGVALLGLAPPFQPITGGELLPFMLVPRAYLWGLGGAALCIALLLLPAFRESLSGIVQNRVLRGRPRGLSILQRYYLDVFFIVFAGVLLWDLSQSGSLLARGGLGDIAVDQMAIATPIIFLLTIVLVLLRVFPLLLRLVGRFVGPVLPAWAGLGLWQMGRRPVFYNQLLVLVMLTVTLGWFGATFGATLDRSVRERVFYESAADMMLDRTDSFPVRELDDLESYFVRTQGVESVTTAYLDDAGLGASGTETALLAVDPRNAGNVFWFRDDFSEATMTDLMVALGGATDLGRNKREIPLEANTLGIWVKPEKPMANAFLYVVVRDAVGVFKRITFGEMDFDEWRYVEGELRGGSGALTFIPPATVEAIELYQPTFNQGVEGRIRFDGLEAKLLDETEPPVLLEGFESLVGWNPIAVSTSRVDQLLGDVRDPQEGARAADFRFGRDTIAGIRGFYLSPLNGPMPILANSIFLDTAGMDVGDATILDVGGVLVHVVVRDVVEYFPPLNPEGSIVIAPMEILLDYVNLVHGGAPLRPNRVLLDLPEDPAARAEIVQSMRDQGLLARASVTDRLQVLAALDLDPLMVTGWRGLVFGVLGVVFLLIIVGYLAYSFLVATDRRLEIGIIRALGLTRRDVLKIVVLEHVIVLALGVGVGMWAGVQLSNYMIPLLSFTDFGRSIIPPFIIETSWASVLVLSAGLGLGVVATVTVVGAIFARVSASHALRAGEP